MQTSTEARTAPAWELPLLAILLLGLVFIRSLGASNRLEAIAALSIMWAIAAFGLYVPFAIAGQMTVAVIVVWGASSFSVALASNAWGWNLELLIPLGMSVGFLAGLVCSLPVLRTSGHYFVVVTLAVVEVALVVGNNIHALDPNNAGLFVADRPSLLGWSVESRHDILMLGAVTLAIVYLAIRRLRHSATGRRWALIRENEQLAEALGINVKLDKCYALAVGGLVVGLAGPLQVFYFRIIQTSDFGILQTINLVAIVILGGRMFTIGPLVGALFLYFSPELIGLDPLWSQMAFGLVLAAVLLVLPDGIVVSGVAGTRTIGRFLTSRAQMIRGIGGQPSAAPTRPAPGPTKSGEPSEKSEMEEQR